MGSRTPRDLQEIGSYPADLVLRNWKFWGSQKHRKNPKGERIPDRILIVLSFQTTISGSKYWDSWSSVSYFAPNITTLLSMISTLCFPAFTGKKLVLFSLLTEFNGTKSSTSYYPANDTKLKEPNFPTKTLSAPYPQEIVQWIFQPTPWESVYLSLGNGHDLSFQFHAQRSQLGPRLDGFDLWLQEPSGRNNNHVSHMLAANSLNRQWLWKKLGKTCTNMYKSHIGKIVAATAASLGLAHPTNSTLLM